MQKKLKIIEEEKATFVNEQMTKMADLSEENIALK